MKDQKKNPAGGLGSNVLMFGKRDSLKNKAPENIWQGLIKPPAQNSALQWERAQSFLKAHRKQDTFESLVTYEEAIARFRNTFKSEVHDG